MLFDPRALLLENTERLTPLDSRLKRILKSSIKTEHSVQQFNTTECFLSVTLTNLPYTNIFIETSPSTVNRSLIPLFYEAFSKSLERMIEPTVSEFRLLLDLWSAHMPEVSGYALRRGWEQKQRSRLTSCFDECADNAWPLFPSRSSVRSTYAHHRQILGMARSKFWRFRTSKNAVFPSSFSTYFKCSSATVRNPDTQSWKHRFDFLRD